MKPRNMFFHLKNAIPSDVRETFLGFLSSSAVIVVALFVLSFAVGDGKNDTACEIPAPALTDLEPYALLHEAEEASAAPDNTDELKTDILSRFVEEKAGGESYAVRVAFAAAVLNRTRAERFGSTISAVLREVGFYGRSGADEVSERTKNAVRDALLGVDPTFGAVYVMNEGDKYASEYEARVLARFGGYVFLN